FAVKRALISIAALALAACASVDPYARSPIAAHLKRQDAIGDCARLFERIDHAIDEAGVRDAQAPRVAGFPYLRVDRLTESLAPTTGSEQADRAWRDRMVALDREARAVEVSNAGTGIASAKDASTLETCRTRLNDEDSGSADLKAAAHVPDNYSKTERGFG